MSGRTSPRVEERRRRIREFLRRVPWGFLATVSGGQPFLNFNLFVYVEDEHCIQEAWR